jgi:hypothetical protein
VLSPPRETSESGNKRIMPVLHENYYLYGFKNSVKFQFHATSLLSKRLKFQIKFRVVCKDDMGFVPLQKNLHFA